MDTEISVQENIEPQVEEPQVEEPVSEGEKPVEDAEARFKALLEKVEALEKSDNESKKSLRSFQSEKDKAVKSAAQEKARADSLEKMLEDLRKEFNDDPEFASRLDKGELDWRRSAQKNQITEQQREIQRWQQDVTRELYSMGVTPAHPNFQEIASASAGATNPDEAKRMILDKAREVKSKEGNGMSDVIANLKDELKKGLMDIRKDLGLDTERTIPPAGGGTTDIKKLLARNAAGDDLTPAERKKVNDYLASLG